MALPGFLNLNLISIIVFILAVALIGWRDRKNIERHSIVFVRRTKRGVELLDDVAGLGPRIWRHWSTLGIVAGFLFMVPMFFLILRETLKLFLIADAVIPVQPLLPTASTFTDPTQAGYFGIPFWYFIISISVVMVVHEMMHGVIARVEDFNVEYVGLLLIGILPGAFVQPEGQKDFFEDDEEDTDEEESQSPWDQGNWVSRLRVLAAGPWANVTLALFLALFIIGGPFIADNVLVSNDIIENKGMKIANVSAGSPADQAGLEPGMVITHVNGNETYTRNAFQNAMDGKQPRDTITVQTQSGDTFDVTLTEREPLGNRTYRPALVDRILPTLEKQYPGAIEWYEAHNDWIVPQNTELEVMRWEWIQENYPELQDVAEQRIQELEQQLEEPEKEGILGIMIPAMHEVDVKYGLDFLLGPLNILSALIYVVALINLAIGTANLLPVKGLDGGWMLSILLERFVPEKEPRISAVVTVTTILLIAISFAFFLIRLIA